jgi:tetratricopeptide (TPR) repeat protein
MKLLMLVLLIPVWTFAEGPIKESYKDLVTIAQNLSLQRDRIQATQLLVRGLKKEKSTVARKELIRVLNELSDVFYTDKAQQLFELGESLRFENPQMALDRYNEALKIEPGNLNIIRGIGRAQLALGVCDKVSEMAQTAFDMNPFADDLVLMRAQALSCLAKTKDSKQAIEKIDLKKSPLKFFFETVKVQNLFFEDKLGMAEEELKKLIEQDPLFPESYYWMAQIKGKQKVDSTEWSQKYVRICQSMTSQVRRKYSLEPRLCLERKNVEQLMEQNQTGENS